jgi:hypothetical protein
MNIGSSRALILGTVLAMTMCSAASAQTTARPPIGDVGAPPSAMIFYVAHGAENSCGPGCSDWIAAEGGLQWDTGRRLIAILDRHPERKLPLVIHSFGPSDLKVAVGMGRILHDRGLDTMVGATEVAACADKPEVECFLLKRPGGPLDAKLSTVRTCDTACILILVGGIHRTIAPGTRVVLSGREVRSRRAPNISDARRTALTIGLDQEYRTYLREMGVDTEVMDIVDQDSGLKRSTEVPPADWTRLHLVPSTPQ